MNKQKTHNLFIKPAILIILAFFLISGCFQPSESPRIGAATKTSNQIPQYFAGISVENRPIMYNVLGDGSDITFIISTIHGDEPAGTPLVNYLADYLNNNPDLLTGRKIVILPVANPDGLAAGTRFNINNIDLNRNFHAENRINDPNFGFFALSEPESYIIYMLIHKYNPTRIVSLHQPYACIDYDGPGQDLAQAMAKHCDLPVEKLGARPGSLGAYAGEELGIPIITFEMRENDSNLTTELLWQKYGKSILAAIVFPNNLP